MLTAMRSRIAMLGMSCAALAGMGACPSDVNEAEFMEGVWQLIVDSDDSGNETFLTFDRDGNLDELEVFFDGGRLTSRAVSGSTDVIGDSVRISTRLLAGRVVFEGEFDANFTEAVGETTFSLQLLGTRIELDGEPARLVRIE